MAPCSGAPNAPYIQQNRAQNACGGCRIIDCIYTGDWGFVESAELQQCASYSQQRRVIAWGKDRYT